MNAQDQCLQWQYKELSSLRIREITLLYNLGLPLVQYQPLIASAREKQLKGVEAWRTQLFDTLKLDGKIPSNVRGIPPVFATAVEETPFPTLAELGKITL